MADEVKLTVRIPAAVHAQLERQAREESRSLNQQIIYAVTQSIKGNGQDEIVAGRLLFLEQAVTRILEVVGELNLIFKSLAERRASAAVAEVGEAE